MGGGGERDVLRHGPDDSSSQSCSRRVLPIDAWCGGGWRACSRWAAVASRRGAAAGPGSAAHREAERRRCHVPDRRCSYEDQPLALLLYAHFPDPEQVVEVPKISLPSRPTLRFPRILQTAEQLVEVSLDLVAKFGFVDPIADIPALRGPYGTSGLRGFLPRQAYSLTAEQIVDNPVPRRGFDEGLHGFPPEQSSAASSEQTVRIPVPHGGRHDLSPSAADLFPDTKSRALISARMPRESSSWPP